MLSHPNFSISPLLLLHIQFNDLHEPLKVIRQRIPKSFHQGKELLLQNCMRSYCKRNDELIEFARPQFTGTIALPKGHGSAHFNQTDGYLAMQTAKDAVF